MKISQSIDLANKPILEKLNPVLSKQVQTSEPESISHKICRNCQHKNPHDYNFCSQCGTALNYH
ncbi:zinc-ribbon domain-containing protein [Okeania sp. SIO2B3]|uniref:zinc-ribbon domain-containing protein n=1 Tax=Okeania sp. SIO2B3 TaxID=2607784 RepID=UPI0025ECBF14|nr:zinc-ribbon domain-containing protein [Okeania sp. SIO2B3]